MRTKSAPEKMGLNFRRRRWNQMIAHFFRLYVLNEFPFSFLVIALCCARDGEPGYNESCVMGGMFIQKEVGQVQFHHEQEVMLPMALVCVVGAWHD